MALKFVQTPAVALYSGMSASATTCKITPYPVDLDGVKLTITDFGTTPTFTVDPKVSGYEEINSFTGIIDNGDNTATLTGLTRNLYSKSPYTASSAGGKAHGASAVVVFSDNPQVFASLYDYINGISIAGAPNATTILQGLLELATTAEVNAGTATGGTGAALGVTPDVLLASNYGLNTPTANEKAFLTQSLTSFVGILSPYGGRSAPTGWLLCDGSAVSRTTYASLLAIIAPSGVVTVTIASPAVFSKTAHGYVLGDKVHFTTTGGLPSGLSTNTDYYVISAGLTANAFEVALSPGGAAVNTSGSQSGVHTVYASAWGKGDGSTTFNLPDFRGRVPIGLAATAATQTLVFEPAAVSAGSDNVTILNTVFPSQGQLVRLTSTGTLPAGLSLATDYYIVRASSTTIQFATTQGNANAATPVVVNITDQGTGVHTLTYTNLTHTVLGRMGGEENHGISQGEMAAHVHTYNDRSAAGSTTSAGNGATTQTSNTSSVGGDSLHNNMQPFGVLNYIIKY